MSDRYNQTSLFENDDLALGQAVSESGNHDVVLGIQHQPKTSYLDKIAPTEISTPRTPVEISTRDKMYPNFSIGDRVKIIKFPDNHKMKNWEGIVVDLTLVFGIQVNFDNQGLCRVDPKYLEKVRVHCALREESETAAQEHQAPSIHYEIKIIKGRLYRYARWWDGDRHRSKYVGKASNFHVP